MVVEEAGMKGGLKTSEKHGESFFRENVWAEKAARTKKKKIITFSFVQKTKKRKSKEHKAIGTKCSPAQLGKSQKKKKKKKHSLTEMAKITLHQPVEKTKFNP